MTHLRALMSASAAVGLGLVLTGCLGGSSNVRPAPSGVEGAWVDPNGIVSRFSGGTFETVTTDTGQKLSEGTYVMTGPNSVQITGTSLLRGTQLNVNCKLISANQLNCSNAAGQQFEWKRA